MSLEFGDEVLEWGNGFLHQSRNAPLKIAVTRCPVASGLMLWAFDMFGQATYMNAGGFGSSYTIGSLRDHLPKYSRGFSYFSP